MFHKTYPKRKRKKLNPKKLTRHINKALNHFCVYGFECNKANYDLMAAACNLWGFMEYDSGYDWSGADFWEEVIRKENESGEPFDF